MARAAIFVLIPVVALLVWRDVVLDRQIRALAYDEAYRDEKARVQIAARDAVIDDAMWKLLAREGDGALAAIKEAARMPAPTGMPERAWLIAAAATCSSANAATQQEYRGWRRDPRVAKFCR